MEELAREQGVNNVGLREVARRAGLSHAAPTHFFGSREGMIRALAFEGLALLDDELRTAQERAAHLPGRERLVSDALEFVAFAQRHPAHFDAMFRTPSSAAGDDTLDRARLAALDGLRALVIEVHAAGDIGGDVETAFLQLCAMSHGIASLAVDGLLHGFDELTRPGDAADGCRGAHHPRPGGAAAVTAASARRRRGIRRSTGVRRAGARRPSGRMAE